MNVIVLCFGRLKDHLPEEAIGNRVALDIGADGTVEDVVVGLGLPREHVFAILVDGDRGEMSTRLGEGSEVTLMPPFTGGG